MLQFPIGRKTLTKLPIAIALVATLFFLWTRDEYFHHAILDIDSPYHTTSLTPLQSYVRPASRTQNQVHTQHIPQASPCPPPPIPKLSAELFPMANPSKEKSWINENHRRLQSLFQCLQQSNCAQNQTKVVILSSYHFMGALVDWNGGEDIWSRSTILALRNMGYTFLYALNMERTVQLYQMFPHLVKVVLAEADEVEECFRNDEHCVLSGRNPDGIPAWKIFTMHWWTTENNPLGHKWTLNPEDYTREGKGYIANNYIGYSVEPGCSTRPFVPHAERELQAYVMAKRLYFFSPSPDRAWDLDFYDDAAQATGAQFIVGANSFVPPHEGTKPIPQLPASLKNVGLLPQADFYDAVSRSRVLVGVGLPLISPTPYDALCLGVPFINPVNDWDHDNPSDKTKWSTQHGMLKLLGPPYVYNVFKGDREGFVKAIKDAIANPIDSFILEPMRMSSVEYRLGKFLETDWKLEASKLLEERKASGEGSLFTL